MNNKLNRLMLGGEWIKTDGGWIRPSFPLITRKILSENDKYCHGEKYPHSLIPQHYNTIRTGDPTHESL